MTAQQDKAARLALIRKRATVWRRRHWKIERTARVAAEPEPESEGDEPAPIELADVEDLPEGV